MDTKRKALGRGLEELFNSESLELSKIENKIIEEADKDEIIEIDLSQLRSNPYQPRKIFDEEALKELSESIKEYGVFQPIIVKKSIKDFDIIEGERRVKTSKMAIGKIPIDKNGNYGYGINAEFLMSKLVMSENLWIENQSGTYKFDDAGFIASSGKNSVRIQPNKSGELFSIYKGNNKQFYVDSDGNVHFAGDLTGSSGTFSGNISGGSINLGNGVFTVDKNGKMYASSGVIAGWNITNNGFSASSYYNGALISTNITPGQILFANSSNPNDSIFMNFNGIAFGNSLTSISKDEIFARDLKCQELKFTASSYAKITCDDYMTITFDTVKNVHFYNTPYIDSHNSYLAREEWCYDKFALKSHSHSQYLTSSNLSSYATRDWVNTRIEQVKTWVRNNFERKK